MSTDSLQTPTRGLKLSQTVAGVSFFLLFPGFLFYHQSVAMGLIPPSAGGLFGYVSLGALLAFLALLPWNTDWLKEITGNRYVLWVVVFLCYIPIWTIAHYLFLSGDYIIKASLQSLETVIMWACLFLIGLLLPYKSMALRWLFAVSFVVIFAFLLYYYVGSDYGLYNARREYGNKTDVASYQGFARSVLVMLLFLSAVVNSISYRTFIFLSGVFVLFLLSSRSDFYAFLAVSAAFCVISGIRNPKYFLVLLLLCLEVLLLAMPDLSARLDTTLETSSVAEPTQSPTPPESAATEQPSKPEDPDKPFKLPGLSRQFEVLDLSSSKSWTGRQALQRIAVEQIKDNPLAGKFGGHVLAESTGSYAHNALSAWVSYGLPGFLIYISLTLAGFLISLFHVFIKRRDTSLWVFAFTLNFICLLLIVAAKSVFWPLPALGWGVVAKALVEETSHRRT